MIAHTCAAKIGARGCQQPREDGKLFCTRHLHASNRIYLPVITVNPDIVATVEFQTFRKEMSRDAYYR